MIQIDLNQVVSREAAEATALLERKEVAKRQIESMVGDLRRQFITTIPGQEMIYLAKEKEAAALMLDPEAECPFLSAEVGVTAPTLIEVAQVVLNLTAIWRSVGAQLESVRISANNALAEAKSVEEVAGIIDNIRQGNGCDRHVWHDVSNEEAMMGVTVF